MIMKSRNLFLGIIILVVGVFALLASFDVIDISWRIVWRLWPLLLIFLGVAVLPIKDWLKALLLLASLALGVMLYHHEASKSKSFWDFSQNSIHEKVECVFS